MKNYVKERRVMCHKHLKIPAPYDTVYPRGKVFVWGSCHASYRLLAYQLSCITGKHFLAFSLRFFPCNIHPAVTKTVLSTNTRSVFLCCLNAIQSLSTGTTGTS